MIGPDRVSNVKEYRLSNLPVPRPSKKDSRANQFKQRINVTPLKQKINVTSHVLVVKVIKIY